MKQESHTDEEISVVYDGSDFRALYRACRRCKRNAILLLVGVPAFFSILSYTDGVRGLSLVFYALPYLLIALVAVLGFYFLSPWCSVRARRKNGWDEPMKVGFTDQGISIRHPTQDSLFYWSKIRDVVVRGPRLFLFTTPSCAIILPRRCFSSDHQFTSLVERAEQLWQTAKSVTVE
jgi:hypothetical protein